MEMKVNNTLVVVFMGKGSNRSLITHKLAKKLKITAPNQLLMNVSMSALHVVTKSAQPAGQEQGPLCAGHEQQRGELPHLQL